MKPKLWKHHLQEENEDTAITTPIKTHACCIPIVCQGLIKCFTCNPCNNLWSRLLNKRRNRGLCSTSLLGYMPLNVISQESSKYFPWATKMTTKQKYRLISGVSEIWILSPPHTISQIRQCVPNVAMFQMCALLKVNNLFYLIKLFNYTLLSGTPQPASLRSAIPSSKPKSQTVQCPWKRHYPNSAFTSQNN